MAYLCKQYADGVKSLSVEVVYSEVGKRIVAARKERGMSQEQLSSSSAIDRSHMGFIEQGRRKPTLSTLVKIANTLDMSLEQLFKGL